MRLPVTAARRGSRGVCPAQSSGALLADSPVGIEEGHGMARVVIGVDPHKRSATTEIINEREQAVGQGRFGTDRSRSPTPNSPIWSTAPAAPCKTSPASAPPAPPACWATSATSAASPTGPTSRPGTAPHRWTLPPVTRTGIGFSAPATGASTASCTSWPSSSYDRCPAKSGRGCLRGESDAGSVCRAAFDGGRRYPGGTRRSGAFHIRRSCGWRPVALLRQLSRPARPPAATRPLCR